MWRLPAGLRDGELRAFSDLLRRGSGRVHKRDLHRNVALRCDARFLWAPRSRRRPGVLPYREAYSTGRDLGTSAALLGPQNYKQPQEGTFQRLARVSTAARREFGVPHNAGRLGWSVRR